MPELSSVINTINIESTMLYNPSVSVEIILDRYILYINPRNLVMTENAVSTNTALNNFLIISPRNLFTK